MTYYSSNFIRYYLVTRDLLPLIQSCYLQSNISEPQIDGWGFQIPASFPTWWIDLAIWKKIKGILMLYFLLFPESQTSFSLSGPHLILVIHCSQICLYIKISPYPKPHRSPNMLFAPTKKSLSFPGLEQKCINALAL